MKDILYCKKATKHDYTTLLVIWERSVLRTHQFLSSESFKKIKNNIPNWFINLNVQVWYKDTSIVGFSAINNTHLEMLFLDESFFGMGYGSRILQTLISKFSVITVDVNEQNVQACNFYFQNGFKTTSRSEFDGMGMPYPLLHLQLQ